MTAEPREWSGFEVAIVGMAGRFPQAPDVDALWRKLRDGVECVERPTDEELLARGEDPANLERPEYVRATTVLDGIDEFDADFFGVTPREADTMDPQHRLFLQTAWHALESAGRDPARPPGPIGIFGGTSTNTYLLNNLLENSAIEKESLPTLFGNSTDYLTTRVSYKLDLRGPSVDVQTSCSSSLVAVHLACQALIAGECDLALAGGVSITIPHGRGYLYREQGIYSPDGHCRAFSSRAQGTVGGSGVAVVALRRLQDALDDGDTIHAVIKGSAINNDGSGKVGYAAPGVDGQTAVIRGALAMADVSPDTIGYVETHGTGTTLGDPIEIAALTAAWREHTQRTGFCRIGSIKTNIGHLDAAAGVTGLIKAALALEHRAIPPSLNCEEEHPAIDFPSTPFRVNTELTPWESDGPRRAAVSSFGIGGTNAHVIVEEAPEPQAAAAAREDQLLVLAARNPAALDRATERLADWLDANAGASLADAAWTLQTGRHELEQRRAVAGRDAAELAAALRAKDRRVRTGRAGADARSVAFLFPGQGAQYVRMGAGLYESEPVFREHLDRACALLEPHLGLDLRTLLYPADGGEEAASAQLEQTAFTQPALFVIEHATAQLLISWGIRPAAMIGHSIGEYVAAALAGVFSLEDALALVAARGRLMQDLPAGSMLAVPLPPAEVEPLLGDALSLAAVNEPSSCVASGPDDAIAALEACLGERRVASRRLHTSHAFHSAMMDPILEAFTERVRAAGPKAPAIPFVSTLTGTWITDAEATDPGYWARHLRNTVRFADGARELLADPGDGGRVLVEVGPGNTLTTLATRVRRALPDGVASTADLVATLRHPREEQPDVAFLLGAVGQLWCAGVRVDWEALHGGAARRRVPLPLYPFERARFWIEPDARDTRAARRREGKLPDVADWFWQPSWRRAAAVAEGSVELGDVLVLGGADALTTELVAGLEQRGARVALVTDPAGVETALDAPDRRPARIVHLWCAEGAGDALERGAFALVALGQALAERDGKQPVELTVVTREEHDVTGSETPDPERAAALGIALALGQELPNLACRSVDLGPMDRAGDGAARVLDELAAADREPVVAWRGRHRWARTWEPVRATARATLRDGVHVLITGGLGSIGLEVAASLTELAGSGLRLTLTGRSDFPARDAWDAWLGAHDAEDETSLRIAKLRELEAAGATVAIERADVTDLDATAAALARAEQAHGPLTGVVHAAGADKSLVLFHETTRDHLAAQLAPKLAGLAVLEELLEGRTLDFCVVQSSLASILGAVGLAGYVAAHQALDAFVARHNARCDATGAQPWTSVNWDNWLSWKEREFAHTEGQDAFYMTPAEGAEAFARALALPAGSQIAVSTGDLLGRVERWVGSGARDESATGTKDDAGAANLHARPDLSTAYQAPSTPAEEILVAAWGDVLGIGSIGVNDGFFELGGDSVLGLQVVAKAARAGLRITPAQIFEHPTIAGLASVAVSVTAGDAAGHADQGAAEGEAPLLPIQRWFFAQDFPEPQRFNLPMLFEVPAGTDAKLLGQAWDDVVAQHDGLRLRYTERDGEVVQVHDPDPAPVEVVTVDVAGLGQAERAARMTAAADELHASLDLERGPLVRAALFPRGAGEPPQALGVIHHLLVDVVSWRVLLEDLASALAARAEGKLPALPLKTASFQAWGRALAEHARSAELRRELDHWRRVGRARVVPLPVDSTGGDDVYATTQTVTVHLDRERTRALLQEVPKAYETRIDEVLLAAWTLTSAESFGADDLVVDLEGHGRENVAGGLDLSRTVGWLTTLYPVRLELAGKREPGEALVAVKEQVRAIPHHGIGYGLLRWMCDDEAVRTELAALPRPEVSLLYLGQFGSLERSSQMQLLQEVSGRPCSPDAPRGHLVEIVAFVAGDRLQVDFSTSAARHTRARIEQLAAAYLGQLEGLIAHCLDPEAGARTPSDFPEARVSQADLDSLMARIGKKKASGK